VPNALPTLPAPMIAMSMASPFRFLERYLPTKKTDDLGLQL
jgi:hypothetical protein